MVSKVQGVDLDNTLYRELTLIYLECFGPNADIHDDPSLASNTLSVEGTIMDALSVNDKSWYDSHPGTLCAALCA